MNRTAIRTRRIAYALVAISQLGLHACSQNSTLPVLRSTADCPEPDSGALIFWMEPESAVRGQHLGLIPYLSTHPGSFDPLPSNCLTDIAVSPDSAAHIETDATGNFSLVVSDAAPLGETVQVRAKYRGQTISARLSVFDPEQSPLVRYWTQTEEGCARDAVIRELVFSADGTFSVTWMPFESYKDYWGKYEFDEETGFLSLSVESGNTLTDVQSGTARLEDGQLILETASFGRRDATLEECRAPFK